MRGRKPDLPGVQEAKGNPGKRKRTKPALDRGAVQAFAAPSYLPAAAKRFWRMIEPDARRMNFLRSTDLAAFARYCSGLARYWEAERAIQKGKSVRAVKTVSGDMMDRINPWVAIRDRLELRLVALEDRLGFTPLSRQQYLRGLASAPPPEDLFGAAGKTGDAQHQPEQTENPIGALSGSVH